MICKKKNTNDEENKEAVTIEEINKKIIEAFRDTRLIS